uniref:GRIP domain-containing protein n=1 Tax=Panagrellus redivivus TaxID=6233 RepID=A0A7E4VL02_PANRE
MFKNLKEKLGADGISATASNLAQQIRTGASETGSDISSYTRKFLSAVQPEASTNPHNNVPDGLREESLISLDDDDATVSDGGFMQDTTTPDGGLDIQPARSTRSRSVRSNASVESTTESLSQVFSSVMKEFPALQSHKDRFNAVNANYNKLVKENEKLRNILTQTQDMSQKRIEGLVKERASLTTAIKEAGSSAGDTSKIEAMFKRFEETIQNQQVQIDRLKAENDKLQKQNGNEDVEKINAEWKGRIDRVNEDFGKKLSASEEKASLAIAQSKAESHALLQQKDQEIEKWINKCHVLEKTDSDANQNYEQKIKDLHHTISALEVEKADMVEKLSKAKQEGVKLVHEEEEKKREELVSQYEQKVADAEKQINELRERSSNLENLEKEVADLKALLNEKEAEATRVLATKNDETEALQQKIESLEAEFDAKDKRIKEAEEKIAELVKEAEDLKQTYAAAADKAKDTNEAAEELRTVVEDFEKKIAELNAEHENTQKELESAQEKSSQLEELLVHERKEVEDLKETVAKFDAERAEIERNALHQYHKDSDERTSNVQAQLDDLLVRIASLQESATEKEAELSGYRTQIEDLNRALTAKSKEILKEHFGDVEQNHFESLPLTAQVDYLMKATADKIHKLQEVTESQEHDKEGSAQETIEKQAAEIQKLDVELTSLVTVVADAKTILEKIDELRSEGEGEADLIKKLNDAVALIGENSIAVRTLTAEKEQRENEALQKETELAAAKAQLSELQVEFAVLQEKLDTANNRYDVMEKEKAEVQAKLESQIGEAQDKINKLLKLNEEVEQEKNDLVSKVQTIVGDLPEGVTVYDKLSELAESSEKLEETIAQSQEYAKANERLARENGEYQAEVEFITRTLEPLEIQGQLHEQIEALVERLKQKDEAIGELEASLKTLKEKDEFLEREISMLKDNQSAEADAEKTALTAALEETKTRIVDLESRNEMVTAALEDLRAHADLPKFVNAVVSTVAGDSEELRNHVSALVEKHLTAQKHSQNVEKQVVQLKEEVEAVSKEKDEKEQQHAGLQKSHDDLRTRYMEKEKVVEELNSQIAQLEVSLKKEQSENQSVIDQFDAQKSAAARDAAELNRLKNELEAKESTERSLTDKVAELEKQLNDAKVNAEQTINKERDTVQQELANVREQLASSEAATAKAVADLRAVEQRLKESDEKAVNAAALEAQLKQVQAELSLKEGDASLANKKVDLFEQEKISLQATVEQLQSALAETQAEIEKIREEKTALATQLQEVQVDRVQNETNTRKIKAVEKHIRDVCRNLEEKSIELEAAQAKIKELEQALSDAQTEDNGFSANDNAFHADLDEIDFLRGENENLRAENATLLAKLPKAPKNGANQSNGVEDPLEMRSVAKQQAAFNHESLSFIGENMGVAETEAEYLRNVIYNYMTGREMYGQQCVSLAKVIGQILKFTPQQQAEVLRKEESRVNHGWSA